MNELETKLRMCHLCYDYFSVDQGYTAHMREPRHIESKNGSFAGKMPDTMKEGNVRVKNV